MALSRQYEECERRAGKWFTIEDIDLNRGSEEGPGHFAQQPSAAEFMARWTVQVATNLDVEAEAKGRPRIKIRPEAKDFEESAELQAVGNRPAGEADEEEGAGAGGGAFDGFAEEVDEGEADEAWAAHRQKARFAVPDSEVPAVAQLEQIYG